MVVIESVEAAYGNFELGEELLRDADIAIEPFTEVTIKISSKIAEKGSEKANLRGQGAD